MKALEILAIAKKFTRETAIQFGAVKGAPCTVSGFKYDEDGNSIVTLTWKNDDGERRQTEVLIRKGEDGSDGISIENVFINEDRHLIIEYSDGNEMDAGYIDTSDVLLEDLTPTVAIGSVLPNRTYVKGTPIEHIIRDILIKTESPAITIGITPSRTVYDIVTEKIDEITISCKATKKTYDIEKIDFYVGSTLVTTKKDGVTSGGNFSYVYTPDTPIKSNTTFKVEVTDVQGNKTSSSTSVSFVGNSYYGFVDPTIGTPSEAIIKSLNKELKTSKGYVYKNIICEYNKVVYAYPTDFGALSSIKDVPNNINYTASFSRTSLLVDGISYYVYTQTDPSGADGVELTFA